MSDVFISYSRKDKAFVQALHSALESHNQDTWVDWTDILPTADWWQEIQHGIEAANTFVFVISPDSVISKVCWDEIEHSVKHNKRMVPIVRREGFDTEQLHSALSRHNWLFFREGDEFDKAFLDLIDALDTDLDYIRVHTRLLVKAIDWDKQEQNDSFLLRGKELEDSEQWLLRGNGKTPQPTELQRVYIATSRQAEITRQRAETRRRRTVTAALMALSILSLGAASVAWSLRGAAIEQRQRAEEQSLVAFGQQLAVQANAISDEDSLHGFWQLYKASSEFTIKFGLDSFPSKAVPLLKGIEPKIIRFSPGRDLMAVEDGKFLRVFQISTGQETKVPIDAAIFDMNFSPDGKVLATALEDGTLELRDAENLQFVGSFQGHVASLTAISFSPDARLIATASFDQTIKMWSLDGQLLRTLLGNQDIVNSVTFSPDGKYLLTASQDNTAQLWEVETGKLLRTYKHGAPVKLATFTADGRYVGTVSGNTTVQIFPVE
jgi:WD40 repeat protein